MKSVVILVDFETTVSIHFIKKHVKILEQDTLLTWNLKIEDYKYRNIFGNRGARYTQYNKTNYSTKY